MSSQRIAGVLAALALTAYAVLLVRANSFVAGGSDSSGYLNAARLLARGRVSEEITGLSRLGLPPTDQEMFIPLGYREGAKPGWMAPSYPPGLPLHMAALGIVGGWRIAPFLAGPIAAIASLLLLYGIARELGLSRGLAAAGSVVLAACPIFFGMAIQPMGDVPATAWVLAVVYFGLRARQREPWAFAAGAALGVAVLVRPTNALAVVPLLFALPPRRSAFVRAVVGGLPLAALLLLYDDAAFGNPISTGYGAVLTRNFSAANFLPQIRNFGFWLTVLLTPLLLLAWLGVGFDNRVPPRDRALLVTWFGALFAFYSFNEVLTDWWSVRYLLPGIPAMILAALLVLRDLPAAPRTARVVAGAVLAAIVTAGIVHIERFRLLEVHRGEVPYRDASLRAARFVSSRSLIAAMQMSGALKYYGDRPVLRWDRIDPERFVNLRRSAAERGIELYALLWPFEISDFASRMPGEWRPVGRWSDVVLYRLD